MSALDKLGHSLTEAVRKILRSPIVDEAAVKELVHDFQSALLQSDVNVNLVLDLSKRIEQRTLNEKPPPGITRQEQVVNIIYQELTRFVGERPSRPEIQSGKPNVFMLIGIQGSGKTTSAAKLARYFQKRGLKTGLVCADTYRLGAYEQLRQLAEKAKIPLQGSVGETDAVRVAVKGVEEFRNERFDVILLDTAGRHKDEKDLMDEMKQIAAAVHPDEIILVIDGTIGQQAAVQAKAFHEATEFGSILLTKLDGSARGGGALSAVAATQVPIRFIGTGEGIDAIESFIPTQFVGRLLGMGDIQGLIQKYREVENTFEEKKQRDILKGRFTLEDMLSQMDAMKNMGPLKNVINMIPGLGYRLPDGALEQAEGRMNAWKFIIQSMTKDERENPKILNSSRMKRIAKGSGTEEKDVKELIKQYDTMRQFMRTMGSTRRMHPAMRRLMGGSRR